MKNLIRAGSGLLCAATVLSAASVGVAAPIFEQSDFSAQPPNTDGFTFGTAPDRFMDPTDYDTLRSNAFPTAVATGGNPGSYLQVGEDGTGSVSLWMVFDPAHFTETQEVQFSFDYKQSLSDGESTASNVLVYGLVDDQSGDTVKVGNTWGTTPSVTGAYTELVSDSLGTSADWTSYSETVEIEGGQYDAVFFRIRLAAGWPNNIVDGGIDNIQVQVIPEPASLALLGVGGALLLRRRHD